MQKLRTMLLVSLSLLLHGRHRATPKRSHHLHDGSRFQKFRHLAGRPDLENKAVVFHVETGLLRSSSLFPYFMLVAFEAGSVVRALGLVLLYPLVAIFGRDFAIRAMVMISFLGLRKDKFLEGRAVLPKFFLEDVGLESFEVVRRAKTKIAVSDLPQVMVERFLVDYLEIDGVVGRDLKVFCGYFLGLMKETRDDDEAVKTIANNALGLGSFTKFSNCKEIYLVSEQERRTWHQLPRDLYPKPLIFHDGRLAFRPTLSASLAMFMWLPVGFSLAIIRLITLILPSEMRIPCLHLTGVRIKTSNPNNSRPKEDEGNIKGEGGFLYVCNHRTLLDPLMISYCLKTPLTAVVYSLSRVSEFFSPIRTARLTRSRVRDAELMLQLLREGDLVVCPEGTTCREPYLLRFSPLFTEIRDRVFPVAINYDVSMFYDTTAGGFKSLDSLFLMMNPWPVCSVRFLDAVRFGPDDGGDGGDTFRFKKANMVQELIGRELGFTCTRLTRKDKYLILAGNDGIVPDGKKM